MEVVPIHVKGVLVRAPAQIAELYMQAGSDRHRRAVAAWMVRRWLLIASMRAALVSGPLPHWWPLLHAAIIVVAALSRLCHLSGTRPAVGAPAENSDCARLTSDLAAAAAVLNVLPVAIALRALHVWPWRRGAFQRLAAPPAAPAARSARYSQEGRPPPLVLVRRRSLQDPRPILTVQDAIEYHDSKSFGCLTDPRTPHLDVTSVSPQTDSRQKTVLARRLE